MNGRRIFTICLAAACAAVAGTAQAFEVTLTVVEPAGVARTYEVVSAGVPLPPGLVKDAGGLRLLNEKGEEVLATFRPLAYYHWLDRSLRWVEVVFPVTVAANGRTTVRLRDDGPATVKPKSAARWRLMSSHTTREVITGGARISLSKQFALFTGVWLDVNGNDKFDVGERLIDASLNHGSVTRDAAGRRYASTFQVQDLETLEEGPLRCVVRVRGTHGSEDPAALRRGLYDYEAYLTIQRDRPWVWVDYILKNSPPQPRGEPVMTDASLITRLSVLGQVTGKVLAERVHEVPLAQNQAAVLYQDSDGTPQWNTPPAAPVKTDRKEQFQGWRLLTGALGREQAVASGLQAQGFVELGDTKWGAMAGLLDFWQTYPNAIELDGGGRIQVRVFPEQAKRPHWIEDQGRAGHRLVFAFFTKRDEKRTSLEDFAKIVTMPLQVRIPADHMQKCGALHDLGPYSVDAAAVPVGKADPAGRAAERARDREYGRQVYGSSWSKRGPAAYLPFRDTDLLFRYAATGDRGWFDLGLVQARHLRDVRTYHVDDVDPFAAYKGAAEARAALPVGLGRRPFTPDKADEAAMAGRAERDRWCLQDEAHLALDEIYGLYLLTGDPAALSLKDARTPGSGYLGALPSLAAAARAYLMHVPDADLRPGAETAMCLRALVQYHELVGHTDPRAAADLAAVAQRLKAVLRPSRAAVVNRPNALPVTPTESGLFLRAVAMAYTVTGNEDLLDLAVGTGDWLVEYAITPAGFDAAVAPGSELKPRAERINASDQVDDPFRGAHSVTCLEPLAWLYLRTGDPRYLAAAKSFEPVIGQATRRAWASCLPYYYHVVRDVDRVDTVPPAAVTDLLATVDPKDDSVTLLWTATGDNGREGTAQRYQVKHAARDLVDIPKLPDQEPTHWSWWAATNVKDEPAPGAPGKKESMKIAGLKSGTYYVALKTWDEAPNASALSNVVKVVVP